MVKSKRKHLKTYYISIIEELRILVWTTGIFAPSFLVEREGEDYE